MIKRNLVTQEELDTLAQIDKDCIRMHVCPPPKTFVGMEVRDGDGNLLDSFVMKSNSWVRNAYNMLATQVMGVNSSAGGTAFGAGALPLKTVTGATRQHANYYSVSTYGGNNRGGWAYPTAGDATYGIVVGSGDTAESFESIALASAIVNGVTSGTLSYAQQSLPVVSYDADSKKLTAVHARILNNNSGAEIIVKEVAWIIDEFLYSDRSKVMTSRDVLATPVTVPNAGQLTVTYTIEMTFPA